MPENNQYQQLGKYLGMAFLLPLCTVIGYVIGHLLDKAFGTHFLTFPFILFGIAAGFVELIRELNQDTGGK